MNNFDEINYFFMNKYQNKIGIFVEFIWKVSGKWKNWRSFRVLPSTLLRQEDWSKIKILSLNSQPRFRNHRMKLIAWMIREIFKMLSQYTVGNPTLPVNRRHFTPFQNPGGMLCLFLGMPSRREGPPSIWDTHGFSGNVFANPQASSSSPCPGGINPWISYVSEHTSPHVMSESQTPVQDQRCHSGPSAKSSDIPSEGDSLKDFGADQQRLQISELHFDKFTTSATFSCWKIRFKTEVCTCSQFPTEAMQWIKEVEMVDSVDDLKIFVI